MIRNLMFDLGGVIMDIRRENCVAAFKELGMADPDEFLGEYAQSGPFAAIEDGRSTPARFRDDVRRIIGRADLTDRQIDQAFGRFLVGIPVHRLAELRELKKHFNLYLLSNTNPIMWADGIARNFAQEGHNVDYYFADNLRSYKAGVMKPDAAIFREAERKFGIKPEETIFLDDSKANCEAAEALGFHTIWVRPGTEFYELLQQYPGLELN
ncbi:MAG: HAD family phosphatase [Firmicutes bacterium]|nr:HAD family phosphatase [Bacillota bacterium]MCM1402146.1 HAD family phosphatase [Bacteroides sp.]MCM1477457.1 HAD family phosphatase [Bacteroides sp.]